MQQIIEIADDITFPGCVSLPMGQHNHQDCKKAGDDLFLSDYLNGYPINWGHLDKVCKKLQKKLA